MTSVLAIDGSPRGGGRTSLVLGAVLAGARSVGATTELVGLADPDAIAHAVSLTSTYDAFVLGAPAYRGAPAAPLKAFIDAMPRGFADDDGSPFTARAVGIVMTGASFHHYLGLDSLRSMLAGFFAAHVLTPGLYVASENFTDGAVAEATAVAAAGQGRALVALAEAIAASDDLRNVRPQI